MKHLILSLEILLFCGSLVVIFLWINCPKDLYFPIIFSLLALLTTGFEIFRRNYDFDKKAKKSGLIISEGNNLFVNYTEDKYSESPKVGLIFYAMKISNNTDIGFKIKDIYLNFIIDGKTVRANVHFIPTDYQNSPLHKEKISQVKILFRNPNRYIVFQEWENFNSQNTRFINKGDVISLSTLFILPIKSFDEISEIRNLKLVMIDYLDNKVEHPIEIDPQWIANGKNANLNYSDNLPDNYKKQNQIDPF